MQQTKKNKNKNPQESENNKKEKLPRLTKKKNPRTI
jgi:hypothetical protein